MTRRRWIADQWDDHSATLIGEQAQHLTRVLRARVGMEFDIVAGGEVRQGTVTEVLPEAVRFQLGEHVPVTSSLPFDCVLSIFKFDHYEWALEKLTELGVGAVFPVVAQRTEKHLARAAAARVERWRRIVHGAAQQSRRVQAPAIAAPIVLESLPPAAPGAQQLLLSEVEQGLHLWSALENAGAQHTFRPTVRIAIGPEGGWTQQEMSWFRQGHWQAVTLGPQILRAETAAIAAASVLSAWLAVHPRGDALSGDVPSSADMPPGRVFPPAL